ncbi:MAG: GDP-mannose 4,6-dehydratase [Cyclobacteriaceae bacterium]
MKKALITGITGQDGAYLAELLLKEGYEVYGLVRGINSFQKLKLAYLKIENEINYVECNILDFVSVINLIKRIRPDEIYNLAAQSSVGASFNEPITTIQINSQSLLNILEAIRMLETPVKVYQASSSEMFGSINNLPITENSVMHPASPYAISKATAHFSSVCYRESYGIFISNGILFNHESYLRGDNFFVKKVVRTALLIEQGQLKELRLGNLGVKRDFGYAPEYVKAMYKMLQIEKGDDFVICSGQSILLRDIVTYVFNYLNIDQERIVEDRSLLRPNEIIDIYGDNTKAKLELKWEYNLSFYEVLDILIEEERQNIGTK